MIFTNAKLFRFLFFFLAAGALFWTGCDKDDDEEPTDEQELITTVTLNFTDPDGNTSSFEFSDTDGPGGNNPVADQINLAANTVYRLELEFLDESNPDDVEDITEEVREEAEEHLVCFGVTGVLATPVTLDKDANGAPLGLENELTTAAAGAGTLTVVLQHEPDKAAANPCTTGETDVQVTFNVTVQ